ncbi:glyoxylate reductase/hydroxypyruvate reductase-like isoform X2 [Ptiloglossa arizonensis]|uniref:glyoxylate reductase/hydroxypyruvate reductase-like isoform X2 n=1 Tax=Ptiloglossa arizonensis TaxID=3350558 RepID=UPI003F9F96A0
MKQTTIEERQIVIRNFQSGKSYREIAKIIGRNASTVQYIVKRYQNENRISNASRKAPNKKFNAYDERWVVRKIKENPKISAPKLTNEVETYLGKNVNPETIRRILRKHNFHGRTARNKPLINEKNRRKRLDFAIEYTYKYKIDDEILNAAGPQLKVVSTMSVGVDHLDLKALKSRNISVGYTPGILTNATAELTVALLLATSRRLVEANRAIYKGEWKAWAPTWMCGPGLFGSTVGIVGLGRIGIQVARNLKSFNVAKILYTSRSVKQEAYEFGGENTVLDELLRKSDFVIVTTALTPETKQMFSKSTFEKMKKTAIFVNVSRGEVVDQSALIEALKKGTIRAAGLDVMTPEPIPLDSELLKLDNCVVLPHIGSAATETREEMSRITAENILAVLKGTPAQMPAPFQL